MSITLSRRTDWTRRRRVIFLRSGVAVVGAVCLAVGVATLSDYVHRTQVGRIIPAPVSVSSGGSVSEKAAPVSAAYKVPAGQPRVIAIPAITVKAYIQRVGVTKDDAMATPNNINFTGWYTGSVVPGNVGNSIINGHVTGKYSDGVFRHLADLKSGDLIKIQMGDLSWRNFSVTSVANYDVSQAAAPLYQFVAGAHELTLITCGGAFNHASQSYNQRTIVKSTLMGA